MAYENVLNGFRQTGTNTNALFINDTDITATGDEINILDGVTTTAAELNQIDGGWASFTTATTPASGSCAVQLVFKDAAGVTMAVPVTGTLYLSKVATGLTNDVAGTSLAVLTNGALVNTGGAGTSVFTTTAAGLLGVTITNGGADSFWIVFQNPASGKLVISDECVENA